MIHGREIILCIGGVPIASSKGCSLDRETDTIEVCSPTSGADKSYIPSTTGWSASANGLYASEENAIILREVYKKRGVIEVLYKTGFCREKGSGIITSLKETGNVGSIAQFSISIQGSGALTEINKKVNLTTLTKSASTDSILVEDGESWKVEQDRTGSIVLEITSGNYRIDNNGDGPIVVVRARGASASTISGILDTGNVSQLVDSTELIIRSGESRVLKKSTSKLFMIVNDCFDYYDKCDMYSY